VKITEQGGLSRFEERPWKVAVVGVGRVGLPLSLALIATGVDVCGVDIDPRLRARINDDRVMPFHEPGFDDLLATGKLRVYGSLDLVPDANSYIITVGSPLNMHFEADVGPLVQVAEKLGPRLKTGDLVVFRSTLAPGLGNRMRKILEDTSDLRAGTEFAFAYCPERLVEGAAKAELATLPQLIGADDARSAEVASNLFAKLGTRTLTASLREAEVTKLFCNASRYIEFAVSNALFVMAETLGCDPQRIFGLANDGYSRPIAARPGLTAGACLRKDCGLLVEGRPQGQLFIASWQLHESMPWFLLDSAARRLGGLSGRSVGVLGLTFKKDTDDLRDSLALKLCRLLLRENVAELLVHDPFVSNVEELTDIVVREVDDPLDLFTSCDVVFIATNHSRYTRDAVAYLAAANSRGTLVVDIWHALGQGAAYIQPELRQTRSLAELNFTE
jgi:UDP-N-acetyl-D-mannosaminuronic acid dehydrogenase